MVRVDEEWRMRLAAEVAWADRERGDLNVPAALDPLGSPGRRRGIQAPSAYSCLTREKAPDHTYREQKQTETRQMLYAFVC